MYDIVMSNRRNKTPQKAVEIPNNGERNPTNCQCCSNNGQSCPNGREKKLTLRRILGYMAL